jgi:hypothetical protein
MAAEVLVGTADSASLTGHAGRLARFETPAVELGGAVVLQAMFEMRRSAREALLPAGLHPTNPATLVVLAWQCPESPWGPFSLCQLRIGCRSGVRTRGLVIASACDHPEAARRLGQHWGFAARAGDIALRRRYDQTSLSVRLENAPALTLRATAPEPLAPEDVQYTGTLTIADTERGIRLVQVEPSYAPHEAERLRPRLEHFDASAWGAPGLAPYHPVSASAAAGPITLPPVRFVCRPDVSAFEGTEKVG